MARNRAALWVLTFSLAFVFGFFGVDKFVHPQLWVDWIPSWMDGLFQLSKDSWLLIIGAWEILTALFLLSTIRRLRQFACIIAVIQIIGVLTQAGFGDVFVRDLSILLSAVALFLLL